jgi:hypothetical protein
MKRDQAKSEEYAGKEGEIVERDWMPDSGREGFAFNSLR